MCKLYVLTHPVGACAPGTGGGWRRTRVRRKLRWPNFIIWRWAGRALGGWIPCLPRVGRRPPRRPVHSISETLPRASQSPRETEEPRGQLERPPGNLAERRNAQPARPPGKVVGRRGRAAGPPSVRRGRVGGRLRARHERVAGRPRARHERVAGRPRARPARPLERAGVLPGKRDARSSVQPGRALEKAGNRPGAPSTLSAGNPQPRASRPASAAAQLINAM